MGANDDYLDHDGLRFTDPWGDSAELRFLDDRCVVISQNAHLDPEQAREMGAAMVAFAIAKAAEKKEREEADG